MWPNFPSTLSTAEDEVDRAHDAEPSPYVVELERLVHVEDREGHEHDERDRLLHDFQLRERERRVADAVGGDLEQVFEERDAPTHERRDPPGLGGELLEVRIPREGHEHV